MKAAARATNPKAEIVYTFVGDQNDPIKARQAAEAQISSGVDFIIMVVNLGAFGVIEAVKDKPVLITTHYTDKTSLAPTNFAGSLTTDFGTVYKNVVGQIIKGTRGGYDEMRPGNGFGLTRLTNVAPEVEKKVSDIFARVVKKEIKLEEPGVSVVAGTTYAIVLSSSTTSPEDYEWGYDSAGERYSSANSGSSWTSTATDFGFKTHVDIPPPTVTPPGASTTTDSWATGVSPTASPPVRPT